MRSKRRCFPRFPAVLLVFAALLSLAASALAEGGGEEPALAALLSDYIQGKNINGGNISIAYYNTVSGEEYLWNGEEYFMAASIYKLPLNMYYYELEAAGEISPDDYIGGYRLSQCHQHSLQYSNNELSEAMIARLGSFRQYKALIAKYGGIPEESLPETYFTGNYFNAAFILNTLKTLYDGREGVYAPAIQFLKDAHPGQWFETGVPDSECTIAQKYGAYVSDYTYIHAVGVVYAPEPFLLAVFTRGVANAERVLGEVARLCYDYNLSNLDAWRERVLNFRDVFTSDWYAESVAYCAERGLINGTSDTAFSPNEALSRAMFVTILGRLSGEVEGKGSFADVDYGAYYSFYVEWAYQNGIAQGVDGANFEPDTAITREQAAVMLHRYLTARDLAPQESGGAALGFPDAGEISGYAKSAAGALRACGIFEGDGDGFFKPQQNFTRAEAAALFMRLERYVTAQRDAEAIEEGDGSFEQSP